METKQAIGTTIIVAVIGSVAAVSWERILDFFIPSFVEDEASVRHVLPETTISYPKNVELQAIPNLEAWGEGEIGDRLASSTLRGISGSIRLPAEFAGHEFDYQISEVSPGGQGRKSTAQIEFLVAEQQGAKLRCGPFTYAFRSPTDLANQIEVKLNAIIFQSYMKEKLQCG